MAQIAYAGERVKLKCPACRSASFELTETMEENVIYEVVDGVMPQCATDHEPGGGISLSAICSECGHKWRPRATLLSEVIAD